MLGRRTYLAFLLAAATLLAVLPAMRIDQHAASMERKRASTTSIAFRRREAGRFALNASHVADLCTDAVVSEACEVLGSDPRPDATATREQLAEFFASDVSDVEALLGALQLGGRAAVSCQAFCGAAVANIPTILSAAAPSKAGLGCIDRACEEEQVDVSSDALAKEGLAPPPMFEDPDQDWTWERDEAGIAEIDPEVRGRMIFRLALNALFGVFPSAEEVDDEQAGDSMLQNATDGPNVSFSSDEESSRHSQYRDYVVKAASWVATAMRKLGSSKHLVFHWFVLSSWEIDGQMSEARKHLKSMLTPLNFLHIKKGTHCRRNATTGGGNLAYVLAEPTCQVKNHRDCGEREFSGRFVINVCDYFWSGAHSASNRVATLVHEASHHYGTRDYAYCGYMDCTKLSSDKARSNADTYRLLVEKTVSR